MIAAVANLHERRGTQKSDAIAMSLNLHADLPCRWFYNLGAFVSGLLDQQQDYSKAHRWFEKAASAGTRGRLLCPRLRTSTDSETANSDKAKTWYLLAAELAMINCLVQVVVLTTRKTA